jgi:hypothetical protein
MSVEAREDIDEEDDEWLRDVFGQNTCHDTRLADSFIKHVGRLQQCNALSIAYGNEYNMPNIVIFSNSRFQWCKKLSFSDPYI